MPDLREPRTGSAPNNSRSLPAAYLNGRSLFFLPEAYGLKSKAFSLAATCGRHPLLRPRRSGSLAGGAVFQPSENCCFVFFTNALQLCEADVFEYGNSHYGSSTRGEGERG